MSQVITIEDRAAAYAAEETAKHFANQEASPEEMLAYRDKGYQARVDEDRLAVAEKIADKASQGSYS